MTLREYMKERHDISIPEKNFCPREFSDFDHLNLTPCEEFEGSSTGCLQCWEQEYTSLLDTRITEKSELTSSPTYEDGLHDAWEFAQFLFRSEHEDGMSYDDFQGAYGPGDVIPEEVVMDLSYEDAKRMYEKYKKDKEEKEKCIFHVGEEIEFNCGEEKKTGWILNANLPHNCVFVLTTDCEYTFMLHKRLEVISKTGEYREKLAEAMAELQEYKSWKEQSV